MVPVLGGAFVCYTIYRNVFVGQEGAYAHLPFIEIDFTRCMVIAVFEPSGLVGLARRLRR